MPVYHVRASYQAHIQTRHFKKYKAAVQNMVKKLEIGDVNLIASAKKKGM